MPPKDRKVRFTDAAGEEFEALRGKHTSHKDKICIAQFVRVLRRLENPGDILSKDRFRKEWDDVYAVKARCGLRGYGIFHEDAFVIVKVAMKKSDDVPERWKKEIDQRIHSLREEG